MLQWCSCWRIGQTVIWIQKFTVHGQLRNSYSIAFFFVLGRWQPTQLTLQRGLDRRLRHRELQIKIEENINISLSEEIHSDVLKIFTSNLDKKYCTNIHEIILAGTTRMCSNFKKWCPLPSYADSFCLHLVSKSPSTYEELRYNGKDGTGFLIQAQPTETMDFRNYFKPQRGINKAIIT